MKGKFLKKSISLTLIVAMLITCVIGALPTVQAASQQEETTASQTAVSTPAQPVFSWDNASVYFLMTDRFFNGDTTNDHSYNRGLDAAGNEVYLDPLEEGQASFQGGDFAGVTQKINEGYFTDLGINAIWISAPYEQVHGYVVGFDNASDNFPHFGYHGYYAGDYTETDKNFGTKEDFQTLVDTAHENGIRIVLDVVINHSGYSSMYDMDEYNFGALDNGWDSYYYSYKDFSNGTYEGYMNYDASQTSAWSNWWGSSWQRVPKLPGYTTGGGDTDGNLSRLPDFKTGDTTQVGIPEYLKTKWTAEGTYATKSAMYGESNTVSGYLIDWITQWVRDYGVDGFRVDTVKHVEMDVLNRLSQAATEALREWKTENHDKALDDLDFWMTGEHWDHGVSKDDYFYNGFDSMINFDLQKGFPTESTAESTFSYYADTLNSDPDFNVLSYSSSHDTYLRRDNDIHTGSILMMMPGGIEIFYGDETSRPTIGLAPGAGYTPGHHLRSFMNWDTTNQAVLAHWQKVGSFRNNHLSIGAGDHQQITALNSSTGYTFSRTYDDGINQDEVVVTLFAPENQDISIDVSSIFANGTQVINAYDDSDAIVQNGSVTFNTGSTGTVLIEAPRSTITLGLRGQSEFEESQTLTVNLTGADFTTVTVDNGEPFTAVNKDTFVIGENTPYGGTVNVTLTATNDIETVNKNYTYEKIDPNDVTTVYFDNSEINWSTVNVHYWNSAADSTTWPGQAMTINGDIAEFTFPRGTEYSNVIFNTNGGSVQTADLSFNKETPLFVINTNSGPKYTGTWEEMVFPLDETKASAIEEINTKYSSYNENDYTTAEYEVFTNIKNTAITDINNATTIEQVESLKTNALTAFDTAEKNTIKYAKESATSEVTTAFNTYNVNDYTTEVYSDITSVKDTAITAINNSTNITEINAIATKAIADMQTVVDNALASDKEQAIAEVNTAYDSYDKSKFTADELTQLENVKNSAIVDINTATSASQITTIKTQALTDMSEIANNLLSIDIDAAILTINTAYNTYNVADFTEEEYAQLTQIKDTAITNVRNATTKTEIDTLTSTALEEMDSVAGFITIYLDTTNLPSWSTPYAYYWGGGLDVPKWTGTKMVQDGKYYSLKVPKEATNIIFNNNSNQQQTNDLTIDKDNPLFIIDASPSGAKYNGDWEGYKTVEFINAENAEVISTQKVLYGEDAYIPSDIPLFRDKEYAPNYVQSDLNNITENKTLTYTLNPSIFEVIVDLTSEDATDLAVYKEESLESNFEYAQIATVKYTGTKDVIGWKLYDTVVSATTSKTYSFVVNGDEVVMPIFAENQMEITPGIEVTNISYATDNINQTAKIYYSLSAVGYKSTDIIKYGVYRTTNPLDMENASTSITNYLTNSDNSVTIDSNVKEHYVMNGDGRYNYVAVVPTNISADKSLSVQAWISINGDLYLSDVYVEYPNQIG